jgi:parvulin-like peptidyl-prolyl isomerase
LAQLEEKIKAGGNFSDLAKEFSDAPSKQYGGLLPAFTRDNAPQVLAEAAFRLPVGQISDPIEADDGWHIIKVENKFTAGGKENVQVSHILIEKETLKQWLAEKKKDLKVSVFLKPLYFKDGSLNQLEDNLNRGYLNEKTQETDFLLNTSNPGNTK